MFRLVALASAVICLILFVLFVFSPATYLNTYGVVGDAGGEFMVRRASPMFAGLALLLWRVRDAEASPLRDAICAAMIVIFGGIAVSGIIAYATGAAGGLILVAAAGEALVAGGFAVARRTSDRPQ